MCVRSWFCPEIPALLKAVSSKPSLDERKQRSSEEFSDVVNACAPSQGPSSSDDSLEGSKIILS